MSELAKKRRERELEAKKHQVIQRSLGGDLGLLNLPIVGRVEKKGGSRAKTKREGTSRSTQSIAFYCY